MSNFVEIDGEANTVQDLLNKFRLWKVIRVVAWIRRFTHNCRSKSRKHNALSTREIQEAGRCLVRMSQTAKMLENDYQEISQRLGLTLDEEGILRCRGRVTGEYPVYIPTNSMLARRIIEDARERTLHGGTTLTMAVLDREIAKIGEEHDQQMLQVLQQRHHFQNSGPMENERFKLSVWILLVLSSTKQRMAYIALYTCATSRAVHLLPDMTADEFKKRVSLLQEEVCHAE